MSLSVDPRSPHTPVQLDQAPPSGSTKRRRNPQGLQAPAPTATDKRYKEAEQPKASSTLKVERVWQDGALSNGILAEDCILFDITFKKGSVVTLNQDSKIYSVLLKQAHYINQRVFETNCRFKLVDEDSCP